MVQYVRGQFGAVLRLFLLPPLQAGRLRVQVAFSHLLLERHDHLDCHVEDAQLRLGLVRLEVRHAHAAELLERFVDVPDADSLPGIVSLPPFLLLAVLGHGVPIVVVIVVVVSTGTTARIFIFTWPLGTLGGTGNGTAWLGIRIWGFFAFLAVAGDGGVR